MRPLELVLLGAPASGKGTQAARLAARWGAVRVSTGDILRAASAAGTSLGRRVAAVMESGGLVSDDLVIELVSERLGRDDAQGGFVLDGFPRTLAQARALDEVLGRQGRQVRLVVQLDVPRADLMERATLRRTSIRTGQIFHLKYAPPPPGEELEHREDDRPETVARRLAAYDASTAALIPFYENAGKLVRVDGVGSPAEVEGRLTDVVTASLEGAGES